MSSGNNPSIQPALQQFIPGPVLSIGTGAPELRVGECIYIRIPVPIQIDGSLVADTDTDAASNLPPTTKGRSPQHFAFIRSVSYVPTGGWHFKVFPIVSLSCHGGAVEGYRRATGAARETLLPLPALSQQHPTPGLFGDPLAIGGCSTPRLSFLHVVPLPFFIPDNRPVSTIFYLCTKTILIVHASSSKGRSLQLR